MDDRRPVLIAGQRACGQKEEDVEEDDDEGMGEDEAEVKKAEDVRESGKGIDEKR